MKPFFLSLAAALAFAAPASAQRSVIVDIPDNVRTPAGAKAYLEALDDAVDEVCTPKYGALIGPSRDAYYECVKKTSATVKATEPTGLYRLNRKDAQRLVELAAR